MKRWGGSASPVQFSRSRAHDCTQRETCYSSSTLSTFPPTELQAQGKLSDLQNWVLAFVPLASLPPHILSTLPLTHTDGKTDDNTPIRLFEALLLATLNAGTWSSRILLVTFGPQMKSPRVINNQVKKSGKKLPSTPRLLGPHEIHIKCVNASDYDLNYVQRLLPSTLWSFFIVKLEAV